MVLQTRNLFESINVKEVNDLMSALDKGCRLTVIDIRGTISATKAHNFFLIRPGTDYAFNLAIIHTLIRQDLYDSRFAHLWVNDLRALREFVRPYTPEWAEEETGIEADRIVSFARELAQAKPAVLWHPGWMTSGTRIPSTSAAPFTSSTPCSAPWSKGRLALGQHTLRRGPEGAEEAGRPVPQTPGEAGGRGGLALPPLRLGSRASAPGLQGHRDGGPIPGQGVHGLPPRSPHGLPGS